VAHATWALRVPLLGAYGFAEGRCSIRCRLPRTRLQPHARHTPPTDCGARKQLDTMSGRRADGGSAPLRWCDPTEPRVARVHTT